MQSMRLQDTSAPLSKFVIHCSTARHELRKQRGTSKFMILVPLFDLKFLDEFAAGGAGTSKSAALASPHPPARPGVNLHRRPGPPPGDCRVALVPRQDHRIGVVGGAAEARPDVVLGFDEDLVAAQLPGGSRELGGEAVVGRQLNIVAGDRVERLAQTPEQLRAQVEKTEAVV